jgi:hypothetical protein
MSTLLKVAKKMSYNDYMKLDADAHDNFLRNHPKEADRLTREHYKRKEKRIGNYNKKNKMAKRANSFEHGVSNLATHATTKPKKPVSRLRAGARNAVHGAASGAALGYGASQAHDFWDRENFKNSTGFAPKELEILGQRQKVYSTIGAALGASRGMYRGMRGLGPVRGTRVATSDK